MTQLLIHPTSQTIRAFENPDLAFLWARGNTDLIYMDAEDLVNLPLKWYTYYREQLGEDKQKWWDALLHYADHVTVLPPWEGDSKDVIQIDLERCKELSAMKLWGSPFKPPKQMRAMVDLFIAEDRMLYTKRSMKEFMATSKVARAFKTRQDPWRIFRYYKERLHKLGVIK